MMRCPVFHVNGEDPEAVIQVTRLAVEFRERFHKDVVIDMFCYRKYGHNEGDEPRFTQPVMYAVIDKKPTVRQAYVARLGRRRRGHASTGRSDRRREQSEARRRARRSAQRRLAQETERDGRFVDPVLRRSRCARRRDSDEGAARKIGRAPRRPRANSGGLHAERESVCGHQEAS